MGMMLLSAAAFVVATTLLYTAAILIFFPERTRRRSGFGVVCLVLGLASVATLFYAAGTTGDRLDDERAAIESRYDVDLPDAFDLYSPGPQRLLIDGAERLCVVDDIGTDDVRLLCADLNEPSLAR